MTSLPTTRRTAATALVAAVLAGLMTWALTKPPGDLSAAGAGAAFRSGAAAQAQSEQAGSLRGSPAVSVTPLITAMAAPMGPTAPRAVPNSVTVPSLGLTLGVRAVGIAADGQMELPPDPRVIGWYQYGQAPLDGVGAVVLAAHVDARGFGAGPLARVDRLPPGATIVVETTAGPVSYQVIEVVSVRKTELDTGLLFDRTGPERLHLVTCGGNYVKGEGWTSNVTIVARRTA